MIKAEMNTPKQEKKEKTKYQLEVVKLEVKFFRVDTDQGA